MSAWTCLDCPERGEGTPEAVDKAADKHGRVTKHSTVKSASGLVTGPVRNGTT